ncbi:hypothetical protein [Streptomyces mangrovi]|uniref:hypothetical protein n=1 Tax=Streptomyces mangrovi TaxID=1206892 RepID=UPI00399D27ED
MVDAAPSTGLVDLKPLPIRPAPVDTGTIEATVTRAMAPRSGPPRYDKPVVLAADLRSQPRLLLLAPDCQWLPRHLAPGGRSAR